MSHDDASGLDRRTFLGAGLAAAALAPGLDLTAAAPAFRVEEATVDQMQAAMKAGSLTAEGLVQRYLARIKAIDQTGPRLRAVLEVNPDALALAQDLDRERKAKGPRGPMHGIPVLLKDNIDTADRMETTAGSLALAGAPKPARDAFVVQRLREAGAVILGKANLSEWANYRSYRSSSGWSGKGRQTRNPYALDRTPSGSSSGPAVAAAASLCAVAVGTETNGSIVSPANCCGVVGFKPTVGLISRSGIIPISHTQDTAGPMTRTVRDAAILLGAMAGLDARDAATAAAKGHLEADYTKFLDADGLKGARLGLLKGYVGANLHVDKVLKPALDLLKAQGATLVEVELPTQGYGDSRSEILAYEFKADLNAYLAARGGAIKDLADLIAFNERMKDQEMPYFGQEILLASQAKGPLTDEAYLKALERARKLAGPDGIDKAVASQKLDALIAPTGGPAACIDLLGGGGGGGGVSCSSYAAVSGYPHITVPAGFVHGMPLNLSFFSQAWTEGTLLRLAYAFEQASKARRAPTFPATLQFT